jgi:hypothetical protein
MSPLGGEAGASSPLAHLRFRRQFLLGPAALADVPGWRAVEVGGGLRLVAHPDLPVTRVASGERCLVLLGFLLDPDRPEATDAELLAGLLERSGEAGDLWPATHRLGGRWALVAHDGAGTTLLHDPGAQRQVAFAEPGLGRGPVAASTPGLLARALGLVRDPEAEAFMAVRGDEAGAVYWMPGDRTMYRGVRQLLPNHLLELGAGRARRGWPGPGALAPSRDPVDEAAALLTGLLEAARRRFRLALPLTAGWDSRLMLALCRPVAQDAWCYTLTWPTAPASSRDVAVPARLLGLLGLRHEVVPYPAALDPALTALFRESADAVKASTSGDVQALYQRSPAGRVAVTGDVAEVAKVHWRRPRGAGGPVRPEELAALAGIEPHPFALAAFAEWLAGADPGPLELLDLFCWEQMAGRWQAQLRADYDMAQDSFAPLACRAALAVLLAVDEAERRGPDHRLFRALVAHLWPEALAVPVNPPEPLTARALAGRALRALGLHRFVPSRLRRRG